MKNIFDKRFYYKEINKKDWKGKKKKPKQNNMRSLGLSVQGIL